jgi:hypothetical protein
MRRISQSGALGTDKDPGVIVHKQHNLLRNSKP